MVLRDKKIANFEKETLSEVPEAARKAHPIYRKIDVAANCGRAAERI